MVVFNLKCDEVNLDEYPVVLGAGSGLGDWDPLKGVVMSRVQGSSVDWTASIKFVGQIPDTITYKYAIRKGQYLKRWESTPSPRILSMPVHDVFGQRPDLPSISDSPSSSPDRVRWVEEGWLVGMMQVKLCLVESCLNITDPQLLVERLVVTCGAAAPQIVDLPMSSTVTLTFSIPITRQDNNTRTYAVVSSHSIDRAKDTLNAETGGKVELNFLSKTMGGRGSFNLVATAQLLTNDVVGLAKIIDLPLLNGSLQTVGSIKIRSLLALPYQSEANYEPKSLLPVSYWKQSRLIGHRGAGAEGNAIKDNKHRVHIRENTVLSMSTASCM